MPTLGSELIRLYDSVCAMVFHQEILPFRMYIFACARNISRKIYEKLVISGVAKGRGEVEGGLFSCIPFCEFYSLWKHHLLIKRMFKKLFNESTNILAELRNP